MTIIKVKTRKGDVFVNADSILTLEDSGIAMTPGLIHLNHGTEVLTVETPQEIALMIIRAFGEKHVAPKETVRVPVEGTIGTPDTRRKR